MPDIIQLLPDSVANQIAAGEVIQRPASVVKELMENAIDAGSTQLKLIIKDAGKTLIQIIDNGCGMSETDARLSFERHATSKIRKAEDLFAIRTMGFRGEALASIAAVAQVELKTKRTEDELGTLIQIEGSEVKAHENISWQDGTSFSVKNLFFNIPARRNFLKTNPAELKHIIDEFHRLAIAHPEISFSMHHNGLEVYTLVKAPLIQRLNQIFGNNFAEKILPVQEETSILSISGFTGKPAFAKKSRGEQFFFVNNRFIKDAYLNHALTSAYDQMLPQGSFPSYFLFIDCDPARIDINIHPTKTEIKFEDEKSAYQILRSTIKRSLGKFSISPSIDFNPENSFQGQPTSIHPVQPQIIINPDYNPFSSTPKLSRLQANSHHAERPPASWDKLFQGLEGKKMDTNYLVPSENTIKQTPLGGADWDDGFDEEQNSQAIFQLHKKYIISQVKSGFMVLDQQAIHERILYEKYLNRFDLQALPSQQQLFPQTLNCSASDAALLVELEPELRKLGFDIRPFGNNTFVIHGAAPEIIQGEEIHTIEGLIEQFKHNSADIKLEKRENLARSMAKNMAIKSGRSLSISEMKSLIDELFACQTPNFSPEGKPSLYIISLQEIEKFFYS